MPTMRNSFLVSSLLLLASSACDDVEALGPDASEGTVDAGLDGDATPVAPVAVVAQALPDAPSLTALTWRSGQLGMVIGSGDGTAHGRIEQVARDEGGSITLRREHIPVSIYLVNGIKLQGQVESFDQYVVLLKNTVTQMVYKHAISTVVPARPVVIQQQEESN